MGEQADRLRHRLQNLETTEAELQALKADFQGKDRSLQQLQQELRRMEGLSQEELARTEEVRRALGEEVGVSA